MSDEPKDRGFGPAVQAAVERATRQQQGHFTDPNWRPDCWASDGDAAKTARAHVEWSDLAAKNAGLRSDTCAGGEPGIASTITPPTIESSFLRVERAELERIVLDLDIARERLIKLLDRS